MGKTEHKSFQAPGETREFPRGRAEIVNVGGGQARLVLQPGWRWSNDVQPITGTANCDAPHFQYHVSGRLAIRMDDGAEFIAGHGDMTALPSGRDARGRRRRAGRDHRLVRRGHLRQVAGRAQVRKRGTQEHGRDRSRLNGGETVMARKMIDCRQVPSEIGCTLTIAGGEEEVLDAAAAHAVAKHGHQDTPELREMLRGALQNAEPALA